MGVGVGVGGSRLSRRRGPLLLRSASFLFSFSSCILVCSAVTAQSLATHWLGGGILAKPEPPCGHTTSLTHQWVPGLNSCPHQRPCNLTYIQRHVSGVRWDV